MQLQLQVSNLSDNPTLRIQAEVQWLGETRMMVLSDDGSQLGDLPQDNIWVGWMSGEAVRLLPLRMWVTAGAAPPVEVWAGIEATDGHDSQFVYMLSANGGVLHADRVAAPWLGQPRISNESERIAINGAWMLLTFAVVAFYIRSYFR